MGSLSRIGGVWKSGEPYVKISGAWKLPNSAWTKVEGVWKNWFLQGGLRDTTFQKSTTAGASAEKITCLQYQPDGKLLISGVFSTFEGVAINNIIRLNIDGSIDSTFLSNIGTGSSAIVNSIKLQSDNKIIVFGNFTTWNGTTVNGIVRLNTNGTRDTAFTTNVGTGPSGGTFNFRITCAIQSDDKIILAGDFGSWNGTTVGRIVRLNADGTRDTAFSTNVGTGATGGTPIIFASEIQPDGAILLGGSFTTWNGTTVNGIVRLNSAGNRQPSFTSNVGTGVGNISTTVNVRHIKLQSTGKIVIAGSFLLWSGVTVNRIVRLNSDGTRDTDFTDKNTGANSEAGPIAIQSDDKIIVSGNFTTWNGVSVGRIVRLTADGTFDPDFNNNTGTGASVQVGGGSVSGGNREGLIVTPDNKILLSLGNETGAWNGTNTLARLIRLGGEDSVTIDAVLTTYLVIAGGGPGGVAIGSLTNTGTGGGGAGGYQTGTVSNLQGSSFVVTVGAGASANGFEIGSNSVFSSITALGGGGGGSASVPTGKAGGSGGGGGFPTAGGSSVGGAGTSEQGFGGGSRTGDASGGGGGAGGVGGNGLSTSPGLGGAGRSSAITGTSIARSRGGAGNYSASPVGGGATGAANTGNGGQGGVNNRASSGWGGSGVVILSYPNTYPNMVIGSGLVIDNGAGGNISGSGARIAPSFTPTGFKVYMFKSGTGNVSW
jgi:uncharacterized delta-60 repeat protein